VNVEELKNWWDSLKTWQKGAVVGFVIYLLFLIIGISENHTDLKNILFWLTAFFLGIFLFSLTSHALEYVLNFNKKISVRFNRNELPNNLLKLSVLWTIISYLTFFYGEHCGYFCVIVGTPFTIFFILFNALAFSEIIVDFQFVLLFVFTLPLLISASILTIVRAITLKLSEGIIKK